MAKRKAAIRKNSIDDLHAAASMVIDQIIPDFVGSSKDIHFSLDIAYRTDHDWTEYIPKNKNTKRLRKMIDNAIASASPHAVLLHIYSTSNKEHCKYAVKLEDAHIPVMDNDEQERKPVAQVQENIVDEPGLGAFGSLHVQRMQDKIDALEKEHDRELEAQREKLDNERRFREMELRNRIKDLEKEKETLSTEKTELQKQVENSFEIMDELEAEVEKNGGSMEGLKNVALMGIASKVLGIDTEELSGLMGIQGNDNKELPEKEEKAGEIIEDEEPDEQKENHPRKDDIEVIKNYLYTCPEKMFRTIITIIQHLHKDPEKAEILTELLTEKPENDG